MLVYRQRNEHGDGEMYIDGAFEGIAYSGRGEARNNPDMEGVKGEGPVPRGTYSLSICRVEEHPNLAAPVIRLTPIGHDAHGRSGFLIHGDNVSHDASHGCIIVGRAVRQLVAQRVQSARETTVLEVV